MVLRAQKPGAASLKRLNALGRRVSVRVALTGACHRNLSAQRRGLLPVQRDARAVVPHLEHVDVTHLRDDAVKHVRLSITREQHPKASSSLTVGEQQADGVLVLGPVRGLPRA